MQLPPRIYNLHPLLAGPIEEWAGFLPHIRSLGFDWVYVNSFAAPGASGAAKPLPVGAPATAGAAEGIWLGAGTELSGAGSELSGGTVLSEPGRELDEAGRELSGGTELGGAGSELSGGTELSEPGGAGAELTGRAFAHSAEGRCPNSSWQALLQK